MPLVHVVVLAALQGFAEGLPLSRSGHGALARLWLEPGGEASGLDAVLHLGTALALGIAARRRLLAALGEGGRAIARPALFRASPGARDATFVVIGAAVSLLVSSLLRPRLEPWGEAPVATGLGLVVTGLALASTLVARRLHEGRGRVPPADPPPPRIAILVGAVHGIAIFPGASRVGAALTVLLWLGVRPARAVDLAFLLTIPALLVAFAQGLGSPAASLDGGALLVGLLLAFLAASVAAEALRRLIDRRRLGALSLWLIPLGLAMLAYARALPQGA